MSIQSKIWTRICSDCGNNVEYFVYLNWWRANKLNRRCPECTNNKRRETQFRVGRPDYNKTPSARQRMSEASKRRYLDKSELKRLSVSVKYAMHRPEVRKRHIEALHRTRWIKVRTDKGQEELLSKWNSFGFKFEINYPLKGDEFLYYLDGYDPINKVVLEYDAKYHKKPCQAQKDLVRQERIIAALQPKKFWRYDATNKSWKNVME